MTLNLIRTPEAALETFTQCGKDADETTHALVRDMLDRLGDKWSLLVIRRLVDGPLRFTALQEAVEGISHRMLTRTVRTLERDGMVSRTAYAEVPPRVEYTLTTFGATFIGPVMGILDWVERNQAQVEAHREAFDANR